MSPRRYVDTHVHIDHILKRLKKPLSHWTTLRSTYPTTYETSIHIACSGTSFTPAFTLATLDPTLRISYGIHPSYASHFESSHQTLLTALKRPETIALGECGLDRLHARSQPEIVLQKQVFAKQMQMAVELNLPLVVHIRENEKEGLEMMREHLPRDWKVHLHCFTGNKEWAKRFLDEMDNLYIGFTGVCTFRNARDVQEAVTVVPLQRLLVETDGPFMAPDPHRGETCTSGMIPHIIRQMATLKGVSERQLYDILRDNTRAVYGF